MEPSQLAGKQPDRELKVREFARSEVFARTFRDGMELVDKTASYLDGDGREDAKALGRRESLAYASASMRVTTHLMQLASWLLVVRAVREGDMEIEAASEAKYRLPACNAASQEINLDGLPEALLSLIADAEGLYERLARIDADLFAERSAILAEVHDAAAQIRSLREAFGEG